MTRSPLTRYRLLVAVPLVLAASVQAGPTVHPTLKAPLQQVLHHLSQDEPEPAIQRLLALQERKNLSRYEQATLKRFLGHAHVKGHQREQAIEAFEQALALKALTTKEQHDIRYQLGQLYLAADKPQLAIAHLRDLDPARYSSAAFYLGRAQSRIGAYDDAIETAQRRMRDMAKPEPDDIYHLLELYRKAGRAEPALEWTRRALGWYPADRLYWQELARLQLQLGLSGEAAATLQAMFRQGMLENPQELDRLIELYLHLDAPSKAAELLEQAMADGQLAADDDNRQRLAAAWLQAHAWHKAETELAAIIAEQPRPAPRLFADLAFSHYKQGHWMQAVNAYQRALASGRLSDAGEAWLLFGIAAVKARDLDTAYTALQEAEAYPQQSQQATQWLEWLDHRPNGDTETATRNGEENQATLWAPAWAVKGGAARA